MERDAAVGFAPGVWGLGQRRGARRLAICAKKGSGRAVEGASRKSRSSSQSRNKRDRSNLSERWERVGSPASPKRPGSDNKQGVRATTPPRLAHLDAFPSLVLNADFRPLSFLPLSLWPWQDVMKAVISDRVAVVAEYENISIRTPGEIFRLPSVISLKEFRPMYDRRAAFSRFNVFLRDDFTCQYCSKKGTPRNLTFDHIVPSCKGGRRNWSNIVTACPSCNHGKGRKLLSELPHYSLLRKPSEPSPAFLAKQARKYPPRRVHDTWIDYLYWDAPMSLENTKKVEDGFEICLEDLRDL